MLKKENRKDRWHMFIELIYICVETKILIDATFQKWNAIKQQQKRLRRRHVRSPTPTPEFREHVGLELKYQFIFFSCIFNMFKCLFLA